MAQIPGHVPTVPYFVNYAQALRAPSLELFGERLAHWREIPLCSTSIKTANSGVWPQRRRETDRLVILDVPKGHALRQLDDFAGHNWRARDRDPVRVQQKNVLLNCRAVSRRLRGRVCFRFLFVQDQAPSCPESVRKNLIGHRLKTL